MQENELQEDKPGLISTGVRDTMTLTNPLGYAFQLYLCMAGGLFYS